MSEAGYVAVLVAAITSGAALLAAVINAVLSALTNRRSKRVEATTEVVREQVQNGHGTNLREEQDDRHSENTRRLEELASRVDAGFSEMTQEFRALWGKAGSNADRIFALEQTGPRPPFQPPPTRPGRHRRETP